MNSPSEAASDVARYRRSAWWQWWVFGLVLFVLVAKNIGIGIFRQTEEALFISRNQRGQTDAVAIGWPFPALSTEAYTTKFEWSDGDGQAISPELGITYLLIDLVVSTLVCVGSTECMSYIVDACNWRPNIRTFLAMIALLAMMLSYERRALWYHHGVGAMSGTVFWLFDVLTLLGAATTSYWLIGKMGTLAASSRRTGI